MAEQPLLTTHIVQPDETLTDIAQRYYGSAEQYLWLYSVNREVIGDDPDTLDAGIELIIPEISSIRFVADHVVQPGETLSAIALQYYEVEAEYMRIYEANKHIIGDSPNFLRVGQVLKIPSFYLAKLVTTHTVQPGDTLIGIAQKYYGDPGFYLRIHAANEDVIGPDPGAIQVGQVLKLP